MSEILDPRIPPFRNSLQPSVSKADTNILFVAGDDDLVCIWNIGEKELVRTIKEHEATIFSLDFSPDGNILLTSDTVGRCKVWAAQPNHSLVLAEVEEAHDLGKRGLADLPCHTGQA